MLRQRDGDSAFFYPLADEVPGGVTVQTAHDSKGTEADHVIIPKVITTGGYPSIKSDRYVRPVKQPPEIYEERGADYQLEEERRMFYVALTRAERRVDVLTVQGAESLFIDELPDETCRHVRPFTDEERERLADGELRKDIRGHVLSGQENTMYFHFSWAQGGILDANCYDATGRQYEAMHSLVEKDLNVVLRNCGLEYRAPTSDDYGDGERIQLQVDRETEITLEE